MFKETRLLRATIAAAAVILLCAVPAGAQTIFGLRAGVNSDPSGPMVGAEIVTPVARSLWFNPAFDYSFGNHVDLMSLAADFHYDFPVDRPALVWAGAGPALLISNPHDSALGSDTRMGLDLLAGLGLRTNSRAIPYVQGKLVLSRTTFGSLGLGVRF